MRRLLFLSLALACLSLLAALAGELPADPEELYRYATAHLNRREWTEADRAFQAYLARFPDAKRAEDALFELGQLHVRYSERYSEARRWLQRYVERYSETKRAWTARMLVAHTWERQQDQERALEAYRTILEECRDTDVRTAAAHAVFRIQDKHLRPYVSQTFTAGEEVSIRISSRNVPSVEMAAFAVPVDEVLERLDPERPDVKGAIAGVPRERRREVARWTERLEDTDRGWRTKQVPLPLPDAGLYHVEIRHAEVTFSVAVLVNRYGLVTRQAAGELVVFAQDRETGAPAPGLPLRIRSGDTRVEGVTGADGLFVAREMASNAFVLGLPEGELVLAHTWSSAWSGRRSRWYVFTDRPIYRPDHLVRFKLVHRIDEEGALTPQPGLEVKVTIHDPRGNQVYEAERTLDEHGSADGELRLASEPALGQYLIRVEPRGPTAPAGGYWGDLADIGRFRVDEYRKPEFEVDVAFPRERFVQGDALEGTITARYYFGSPVPGAQVSYRILRAPHWPPWGPRVPWLSWYAEEERVHPGGGEVVHQGKGETGADGRLAFSFPLPRADRDQRYTVVAQVTDLSRRQVEGQAGVLATQGEFALHLGVERALAKAGDAFPVTVRARTYEGAVVVGQEVALKVHHRIWKDGAWEERELHSVADLVTDETGSVTLDVQVPVAGSMRLAATARDARGNRVTTEHHLWVVAPDWHGGAYRWQGLEIVADKPSYAPGETATLLITSQAKGAHLLLTLEGDRIHRHRVVALTGNTATVEVRLDSAAFVPNVYATVVGLHGGAVYQATVSLAVDPTDRFLTVTVRPDRERYRPREPATFTVETRDPDGNPVSAEVALSVVDESIYALQPELAADIRRFFVPKKWNRVAGASSLQFWDHGRVEEKEGLAADAAEEPGARAPAREVGEYRKRAGDPLAATEIRAEFADTLLWRPTVVTGADGRATVTLDRLADNLTTWRVTARGIGRGLVGQESGTFLVRKDVIARLHTPRFLTQGDRSYVTAVVRNDLDAAKRVRVELAAEGVAVEGELVRDVDVAPRGEARLDWVASAHAPGRAVLTLKALTDEESDAMQVEVPVLPHGSLKWSARAGLVEGRVTETLTLPEGAIPEASSLLVVVSPSHAATVLDALDYLAGYPYGCTEQTMSRFLPTVMTRQVLQGLGIEKPGLEEELPHMLAAGLQRLYAFQHADGGWGWWKHDESSPFLTAYVVYGLSLARRADVAVDGNVVRRGVAAARRLLEAAEDAETRAYLLFALSTAGERAPDARNALADGAGELPAAAKAMLALVLAADGEDAEARRVLGLLADEAVEMGAGAHWRGAPTYRWTGHAVEATALALKALLAVEPGHALVKPAVAWLALQRDGNHWVSTRQTAMVVFALADYLARTGEREPDLTLTLDVNGARIWSRRVTAENGHAFDGTVEIEGARLRPGDNVVAVTAEGSGTPVYALYLKHFEKAERFAPSRGGLRVERRYALVTHAGGKRTPVPLADGAEVASGAEVEVTLTVTADRPYRYLILEDPMPAGFEAVRPEPHPWYGRPWGFWYAHREFRDEKVDVAVTYLPEGERSVTYVMRAETPGTFRVLPTLVWNMYQPGEGGNGAGATLRVGE